MKHSLCTLNNTHPQIKTYQTHSRSSPLPPPKILWSFKVYFWDDWKALLIYSFLFLLFFLSYFIIPFLRRSSRYIYFRLYYLRTKCFYSLWKINNNYRNISHRSERCPISSEVPCFISKDGPCMKQVPVCDTALWKTFHTGDLGL